MVFIELAIEQTAESLQSLRLLLLGRFYLQRFSFEKNNTTPAYLTMPCALFFSTNTLALALVCYNSPLLISRTNAILENERDEYTLTVGISLRVLSFQARVSGQIFVGLEFRPIKLEYYLRVPNCVHAPTDDFWEYIKGVE